MNKLITIILILSFTFVFLISSVSACSCAPPADVKTSLEESDAVFYGKVIYISSEDTNVKAGEPDIYIDYGNKEVKFEIIKSWKGVDDKYVTVTTASNSAACGFSFQINEEYIVYAYSTEDPDTNANKLSANICSRTSHIQYAQDDKKELDELTNQPDDDQDDQDNDNEYEVDFSCRVDSDCEIKKINKDCCGPFPTCVNANTKIDPNYKQKYCNTLVACPAIAYIEPTYCNCQDNVCVNAYDKKPNLPSCGNGVCEEVVCLAIGCPDPETAYNCPQDCKKDYDKPICGNGICEYGEANEPGGCGPNADPRCLGPPAREGTCPKDCSDDDNQDDPDEEDEDNDNEKDNKEDRKRSINRTKVIERVKERLGELNYTVDLKDYEGKEKRYYLLSAVKKGRLFGLFNMDMNVEAQVDEETGEIIKTKRPWWAFLVRE